MYALYKYSERKYREVQNFQIATLLQDDENIIFLSKRIHIYSLERNKLITSCSTLTSALKSVYKNKAFKIVDSIGFKEPNSIFSISVFQNSNLIFKRFITVNQSWITKNKENLLSSMIIFLYYQKGVDYDIEINFEKYLEM